jgi:hypothetical protein
VYDHDYHQRRLRRWCHVGIRPFQAQLELKGEQALSQWDQHAQGNGDRRAVTEAAKEFSNGLVRRWWQLSDLLIAKYSDGYVNGSKEKPQNSPAVPIGYPSDWLGKTDYPDGPTSYDMKL